MRNTLMIDRRRPKMAYLALCLTLALAGGEPAIPASLLRIDTTPFAFPLSATNEWSTSPPQSRSISLPIPARRRSVGTGSPAPSTTIWTVINCADSGIGSLRDAIAHAGNVDTIDMTNLTCATITLTTGAIVITQDDLIVNGRGIDALTIDAANFDRAFVHTGSGNLYLNAMTVTRGYAYAAAGAYGGGCIYSAGAVLLDHVIVSSCEAYTFDQNVAMQGGGIYANVGVALTDSMVTGCSAIAAHAGSAFGGGVFARNEVYLLRSSISDNKTGAYTSPGIAVGGGAYSLHAFEMKASTLTGNSANADSTGFSLGGGVSARTEVQIFDSTIDGNTANQVGGCFCGFQTTSNTRISNSTVSGNVAREGFAGALTAYNLQLVNSTIAFNQGGTSTTGGAYVSTGAYILSSIIANNSLTTSGFSDLYIGTGATLTGSGNLVMLANQTLAGTLTADPMLGPLQNNGGVLRTHALLAGSPAIDAGNNLYNLPDDERGIGFPRVIGANADIGAFEVDTDLIFKDGFD